MEKQSPSPKLYLDSNLLIVFGVTLMAVMGVASIAPALPSIMTALNISQTEVGLLIVAFTLPGVVFTPFTGVLADRLGRKPILIPALFLFGIAGGACAFTTNFHLLLVLRAFQGVGAAALGSLNVTLIGDLYAGRRRTEAMGLNATVLNVGALSYPLLGGILATLAWNYPFLMTLLGIPVGIVVLLHLHNPEIKSGGSLTEYLSGTWRYLKNIRALSVFATGIIGFILLYGALLTYVPLYLGDTFGASPFIIGVITSIMSLISALVASQLGRIAKAISVVNMIKIGFVVCGIALAVLPLMPALWLILVPVVIYGAGWAILSPSVQTYVAGLAPAEYRAAFMSINGTMFRLGQTLGPLIIGVAYTLGGFSGAFYFGAGLALLTALVGFVGGKFVR